MTIILAEYIKVQLAKNVVSHVKQPTPSCHLKLICNQSSHVIDSYIHCQSTHIQTVMHPQLLTHIWWHVNIKYYADETFSVQAHAYNVMFKWDDQMAKQSESYVISTGSHQWPGQLLDLWEHASCTEHDGQQRASSTSSSGIEALCVTGNSRNPASLGMKWGQQLLKCS